MLYDFEKGLEWLNSEPLSFESNLKGKIVVLDFWAYCCINCMHVLPDLAYLEEKWKDAPVAFIGVHSAKFTNEQALNNIRQAVLRYDITHPVVNDPHRTIWDRVGVGAWPTFVIIGPDRRVLFRTSGEGKRKLLDQAIEQSVAAYGGHLDKKALPIHLERDKILRETPFLFPGKIAIDKEHKRLFISDSNNGRIAVSTLDGKITKSYPGFNKPQGVFYERETLFVADTENGALKQINLETDEIKTLASRLNTPWDVVSDGSTLYLAMAGSHQIWRYSNGVAENFSGTGREMNDNGALLDASFAQPSGLAIGDGILYIADSESSSVRAIHLREGVTETVIGGDPNNPFNLFRFGDSHELLQHPLGVCLEEPNLFIADTYNHRIKIWDTKKKELSFLAGTGKAGDLDGSLDEAMFSEPSGLCLFDQKLYVADTNNHKIRVVNLLKKEVSTLPFHD